MAERRHGETPPETLERVERGNGMIVNFRRGRGEVFTAACCEWVNSLRLRDNQAEQVTRNVLRRFAG
ncbi:MAG: hypothetical protein GDA49_02800 [Rhodospirillales bacterium]|nr:hypothetical protein [Rhodospirillales bacterium]